MDIQDMTGEKSAQPAVKFDTITLNGREGKVFVSYSATKEKGEDGFYPREELETPFAVTFLIRKMRFIKPSKDGLLGWTDEFDTKNDVTTYYFKNKAGQIEKGDTAPAYQLKDDQDLKSEAIVYVRRKGKVERFKAKGLSITPQEDRSDFYSYLYSFQEGDNFWKHLTEINVLPQETSNGTFYRMTFKSKRALTPDEIAEVEKDIRDTFGKLVQHQSTKQPEVIQASAPETEDIHPDDIPF
jgi:hypothetical protein